MTVTGESLTIYQGEDQIISVTITESGVAKNLTGATGISFKVFSDLNTTVLEYDLTAGIVITDAEAGEITITVAADDTADIAAYSYPFTITLTDSSDITAVVTTGVCDILFNGAGVISLAEVVSLVNTELTDVELSQVLQRVISTLKSIIGDVQTADLATSVTEELYGEGQNLFVCQRISSVTSITEDDTLLDAEYYRVWEKQGRVQRLPAGTVWGDYISIVYVPEYNHEIKPAIIDLCRLEIERKAVSSESIGGEYSFTALANYDKERQSILRRIRKLVV